MDSDLDQRLSAWMRKAQDGDRQAYEALLTEVAALLRNFTRTRVKQAEWVDDVVQETLISIHQDRHTYDPGRSFGAWMYAIARHRLIDFARKQRRRQEQEQEMEDFDTVAGPIVEEKQFDLLHRALKSLSNKQREVIQLLKLEGFSVKEIARKTGMSESSIKVRAHRGYKHLRRLIVSGPHED